MLRWAGSKRQLLPRLRSYWEASGCARYVEPFAGSAAHFFDVEPRAAVLSDVNRDLVGFYQCIQRRGADVFEQASAWPIEPETYYRLRKELHTEQAKLRRAAIFFYLNRNCFNGIFRTNLQGHFNVPFSGVKTGAIPSWDEFEKAVDILRNAEVVHLDFEQLVRRKIRANDFVYLDPPYAVNNRRVFVQYNAQTFGLGDLQRLSDLLHCIDAIGAKFLLSYAMAPEAQHYFSGWTTHRATTQRNVGGFVSSRRRAVELLVSNIQLPAVAG